MEEYVYIDGKKYKRGYTTGSCAAAASKASVHMLLTGQEIEYINIDTPKGIPLTLKVKNIEIKNGFAVCSIEKDGGDDIDATHTMDIFAKAELVEREDDERVRFVMKELVDTYVIPEEREVLYSDKITVNA